VQFVLIVFHLLVTLILIGVILLQKGEDGGAAGSGSSNPLFSTRSSKNGLTMATSILATLFFLNCIVLAILIRNESRLTHSTSNPPPAAVQSPSQKQ
jgi:preprotein translocase subunit SecG